MAIFFYNAQKAIGSSMTNTTDKKTELTEVISNPTPELNHDPLLTCALGDKECLARLIQAFSDCD